MKIRKSTIDETGFVLYLFCFIFAPPLVPKINFIFLVFAFSVLQLFRRKNRLVNSVFTQSGIKQFCYLMFLAYVYIGLVMLVGILFQDVGASNYIKTFYRFGLLIPITVTCVLYIIVRSKEMNYNFYDILHAIIKAGTIQAIIAILMFLDPSIKQLLVNIMFANTGDSLTQNLWVYQRRLYAFSNSVLDSFGYGTGIIAALPLFLAKKRKTKYLLYIPVLLVVPFLNSRTGLIVFLLGIISVIPLYLIKANIKKLLKTSISVLMILICLSFGYKIMQNVNPMTTSWVENGITSFLTLLNISSEIGNIGYTESTTNLFSDRKWYVPGPIGLLFGTGHNVYEANGFNHSDVGYINDLWLGGILGMILLYSPLFILLLKTALKQEQREIKYLLCFLFFAFLATNVKAYMINYNVGMAVTLLVAFSAVYFSEKKLNNSYKEGRI
ncbi:hypothetical protein [Paenibacillus sp. GXUN7292]|uniref:hypothetical protein n=1 Tax=Paenibacillus sp. GXUN7292 TaxID=3422499 RepID=UPI003D7D3612